MSVLDGHLKEPYEMSMARGPDCRTNFYSWPAHLCAVTYIIKISLNVLPIHSFTNSKINHISYINVDINTHQGRLVIPYMLPGGAEDSCSETRGFEPHCPLILFRCGVKEFKEILG